MLAGEPASILFVVNDVGYFQSHRRCIADAAMSAGFRVHVAYGAADFGRPDSGDEIEYHFVPLERGGVNPFKETRSLVSLIRLFLHLRPSLVHLVTLKPVLYGGLAARIARTPCVVSAVAGLGSLFIQNHGTKGLLAQQTVRHLLSAALNHGNQRVIVQNHSDLDDLERIAGLDRRKAILIGGSGVDLNRYKYATEPDGEVVVTMASRLVRDKGVYEFVEAARYLRRRGEPAKFLLVGAPDAGNPSTVDKRQIAAWVEEGVVQCLGHRQDIAQIFSQSHIVVLPSYREGLPKTLLEAQAIGRVVVTTDVPGCRDAIEPGVTGELVPVRNASALANSIGTLIRDVGRRREMGLAGRALVERRFDASVIAAAHMRVYCELTARR